MKAAERPSPAFIRPQDDYIDQSQALGIRMNLKKYLFLLRLDVLIY